jgi:prephenate dehydrogenase
MGAWFARFFKSRGDSIIISDRDLRRSKRLAMKLHAKYSTSNADAARGSDMVLLAVPTSVASEVVEEILPVLRKKALICEISATKSVVMPAIRSAERRGVRVASIHPMFGPLAHGLRGRRIIAVRTGKNTRGYRAVKHLLQGARFFLTDSDVHDKRVALTLGLPHFLNMAFALTLARRRDLAEIRKFAGRTFNLQMLLAEAIADEPETTADIQVSNKEFLRVLRELQRNVRTLARIVNERDRSKLVTRYKKIRKSLCAEPELELARATFEKVTEAQSTISRGK